MSEEKETENQQVASEQLSDILLVLDKEKMKIQAVKSIDKSGKMETVDPTKKNQSEFMRVDKHGDFVTNFLSNFWRQLKDPTKFALFKVSADEAVEKAKEFQNQINNPTAEGKKKMEKHEVKNEPEQEQKQENKNDMTKTETTPETSEYRFQPEQIDWETMNNLGLSKEYLEKKNLLDPLLRGYKTNELVPISVNLGGAVVRTDARLSLQSTPEGDVVAAVHGIRREPNLNFEFFGHKFSDEDKQNLRQTGNMGRVVDLINSKTGELMPSIISVDRLTNELIALKTDFIKIPDEVKGIKLNDEQKQTLVEGKPLFIEGMISTKGTPFDANVQFNADKRYVEFLFDRSNNDRQTQNSQQDNQQSRSQEAPKTFRGKELEDDQYNKFKDGQTVYIPNLVDKKGQTYNGYITFNKETGKTNFEFPNQYKERIKPTEAHKTQIAVNSEGKTNEATKNIKEPLQKGQQRPKNEKQQEQQNKPKAPAKSKGRKVS
ncbi:DUF3945 domain-containing protein [Sphingobacterium spiritivorum]|uniref:DUF3945 domain-containing protein n=1 Tax=Sphingobacterium spiritivorum ATCC 33861 TaxID=525373 RepID=D7VNU4_SPHSI|nr:DUF3945 domain-containing protein [Sphingobacterium spiritivorum]EFK57591.1 hypothetical protein HMPREF0766_12664 [Sphingobacterium spiritivorum ATCC 33861]QQT36359.1 DUF3945 domain-containing protein [Sphingobacterium spiritivorum]WQD33105.1 DUF3945 domain-containing protein [Sphingobacterium spiritivorum]SUJ18765.1 Uncharacterised protein [Sphingobacterium spiritivorum]